MACPAPPPVKYADAHSFASLSNPLKDIMWTALIIYRRETGRVGVCVSGLRTDWMQYLLRKERCGNAWCSPSCKGHPTTAMVGKSKHRLGDAVDVGPQSFINWLHANARRFGIGFPVPGEDWHVQVVGVPQVTIWKYGVDPDKPTYIKRRTWIGFGDGASDESIGNTFVKKFGLIKYYGETNEVTELQLRLNALSKFWGDPKLWVGEIDGDYGPATQKAVNRFKTRIIAQQKEQAKKNKKVKVWANNDSYVGQATIDMVRFMHSLVP